MLLVACARDARKGDALARTAVERKAQWWVGNPRTRSSLNVHCRSLSPNASSGCWCCGGCCCCAAEEDAAGTTTAAIARSECSRASSNDVAATAAETAETALAMRSRASSAGAARAGASAAAGDAAVRAALAAARPLRLRAVIRCP